MLINIEAKIEGTSKVTGTPVRKMSVGASLSGGATTEMTKKRKTKPVVNQHPVH